MVPTLPVGLGEEREMEHDVLGLRTEAENGTDGVAINLLLVGMVCWSWCHVRGDRVFCLSFELF